MNNAKAIGKKLASIEERLAKIEAYIANMRNHKASDYVVDERERLNYKPDKDDNGQFSERRTMSVKFINVTYISQQVDEDLDRDIKTFMTKRGFEIVVEKFSKIGMERELKFVKPPEGKHENTI